MFSDSPEYCARRDRPFSPTKVTIAELRAAIPKHLFEKNTTIGLLYVLRDIMCAVLVYKLGWLIEPATQSLVDFLYLPQVIGTFVLAPYHAWRASHHAHHKATVSIERDENYVPRTRKDYGLPPEAHAASRDYHEIFEETPIYTLARMMFMQLLGWQVYLLTDISGSPRHPTGTNHFMPTSPLFKDKDRRGIIASNLGISFMTSALYLWSKHVGVAMFVKLYLIPYILLNHWIVMLTYLHHSDPTVPMYRNSQWSFVRGATSTVDRPLLGWAGRFFFHNVSHDHISHHLFSSIPFYNQPLATAEIKKVLKDDYNYDSTNSFRSLYRTFTQCCFIEDEGDIVFYKNREGKAARVLSPDALTRPTLTAKGRYHSG
ncbi:hypothetical protein AAF712_001720 [Marasmius tenuissimus]|uniref:Fatty acid desaturase domain-containing protein n=1 Tax=Marasmius tenuissimus TaxID=585030 RepID=A0ABR3AB09_9AGAR